VSSFFALYENHGERLASAAKAPVFSEYDSALEYWEKPTFDFSIEELAMFALQDVESKNFCLQLADGNATESMRLYDEVPSIELFEQYVLQTIRRLRERQMNKIAQRHQKP
jgi:hypothetical protein